MLPVYKKVLIVLVTAIVLALAYWLISPLWRVVKVDEALPEGGIPDAPLGSSAPKSAEIHDALDTMSNAEKAAFMLETKKMENDVMQKEEPMPEKATVKIIAEAPMLARAHEVEGQALFVEVNGPFDSAQGKKQYLRFENLKTVNGPDLFIYLSSDLGDGDFVSLGRIRATEGNVNYEIPEGTDLTKYNKVLIWCRAFSVLFSYVEL